MSPELWDENPELDAEIARRDKFLEYFLAVMIIICGLVFIFGIQLP